MTDSVADPLGRLLEDPTLAPLTTPHVSPSMQGACDGVSHAPPLVLTPVESIPPSSHTPPSRSNQESNEETEIAPPTTPETKVVDGQTDVAYDVTQPRGLVGTPRNEFPPLPPRTPPTWDTQAALDACAFRAE